MEQTKDLVYLYAKNFMLEIMAVLWMHGQRELHVGAMMRLMGVDEETARRHDHERVPIDDEFGSLIETTQGLPEIPKNTTWH